MVRRGMIVLAALLPMALCAAAAADEAVDAAAGEQIYEENCAACHGEKLRNQGQAFDLRKLEPNERARFDKAVQEGRANMPPWRGVLSDEQFDQLWAYVMVNAR